VASFAQSETKKSYSLDDCITTAITNNLDLKSAQLVANDAKVDFKQAKANLLPTLNANYNIGVNNGRSIDPFTNDFIDQKLTFSNAGLSLDMTVFNGFNLLNTLKQNQLNKQASEMEYEAAKQDLVLNVTLAYLQVLNAKAVLQLANSQLEATKKQVEIQKGFYENEAGNPADYTDILGQQSNDETNVLTAKNNLENAKLSLKLLLNLDTPTTFEVNELLLDVKGYSLSAEEIFNKSLQNFAAFEAQELRTEAAKKGISVAKSQYTPTISFFGQLNTNYSSAAETFSATGTSIEETGDFVTIDNQQYSVFTESTLFDAESITYSNQFENNLNSVAGIAVSVPIFNGFSAKNNVAIQKIVHEESLLELERNHQQIKNAITQVHFSMEAAYKRYQSFLNQVEAYTESYRINEIRFNNGVSNFLNYITSKNNLDNAKINLANAKYEYLLRVKILDYYGGLN